MDIKKPNLNFNLNIDLGNLGKKFKKFPAFLDSKRRISMTFLALLLIGHVSYEYYIYVYHPVWSEKQKQTYIATKEKEAVFDEKTFNAVISEIEKRKIEFADNKAVNDKDIFKVSQ